jgi:hypothetical protein
VVVQGFMLKMLFVFFLLNRGGLNKGNKKEEEIFEFVLRESFIEKK